MRSGAGKANRTPTIGIFEPFAIVFHTPLIRVFTHRTIVFSHTESRVFTHHRFKQTIDPKGGKDHFLWLNLLNDSYLTESFNVGVALSGPREKVKWNRPMADVLSFRAAYGVTRAAQAPLARRGRSRRVGSDRPPSLPRCAVRAGEGPLIYQGRRSRRTSPAGLKSARWFAAGRAAAINHAGSNRPANSRSA